MLGGLNPLEAIDDQTDSAIGVVLPTRQQVVCQNLRHSIQSFTLGPEFWLSAKAALRLTLPKPGVQLGPERGDAA
ncbi:hypothetical protein D3C84_1117230 [compost metagenome]